MDVSRKSALKKVGASAELPALWVPALLPGHNCIRKLVPACIRPSYISHWVKNVSKVSWYRCWQITSAYGFRAESELTCTELICADVNPHVCVKMLSKFSCSHPGLRRLLMDLIFRLCSVLRVSWSAETVTRCWQWPQWINNVVKTTMITAGFIILMTPKKSAEHHSKCPN